MTERARRTGSFITSVQVRDGLIYHFCRYADITQLKRFDFTFDLTFFIPLVYVYTLLTCKVVILLLVADTEKSADIFSTDTGIGIGPSLVVECFTLPGHFLVFSGWRFTQT